jgi:CheY-like chemotaxis protein
MPAGCRRLPGCRLRVLIIDDEPSTRVILRAMVAGAGCDSVEVEDAVEALQALRSGQRFDVIFCDIMMPHMTGREFRSKIGTWLPEQAERVVLMTSNPALEQSARLVYGNCLPKPLDREQVVRAIETAAGSIQAANVSTLHRTSG